MKNSTQAFCDVCGPDFTGIFYTHRQGYDVLRCPRCALIWTDPLFSAPESQDDAERAPYYAMDVYKKNAESQKERFAKQLQWFLKTIGSVDHSTGVSLRVLEVGSGMGYFLDVCERAGVSAEGCDINETAVIQAAQNKQKVRLGSLDDTYRDNSYDAVFAFNLIEHLPHPKEFLVNAKRVLKPNGSLVVETPIQESLFHEMVRLGDRILGSKLPMIGVNPGGHIYQFSKRTWDIVCSDLGLEKMYEKQLGSPYQEITGKFAIQRHKRISLFRLALPVVWAVAEVTNLGNRLFLILRKRSQ